MTSTLAWVTVVTGIARSLLGDGILLLGVLRLGADGARATLDPANRPAGTDDDAVADWLRELARVRPAVSVLEETLLGAEVVAGAARPTFAVAQAPARAAPAWVAITPPRTARPAGPAACWQATAPPIRTRSPASWSTPGRRRSRAPAVRRTAPRRSRRSRSTLPGRTRGRRRRCSWPCRPTWTRGWRMEDVQAVVEETFQLARVRTLDLVDLPELRGALPPEVPFLLLHDLVPN